MPRYFVKFPTVDLALAAQPMLDADPVRFRPFRPMAADDRLLIADLSDRERMAAERNGAVVYDDVQFDPLPMPNPLEYRGKNWAFWSRAGKASTTEAAAPLQIAGPGIGPAAPIWQTKSLHDVLDHIGAPAAWARSRGAGVTIGIVDTGVSSVMPEFPASKRSPYSISFAYPGAEWQDPQGHGSMCACIAAGTTASGGRYDGVAPDATVMALRSSLASTDIYRLYDWVIDHKRLGAFNGPVVMSNSYGLYTCNAPSVLPEGHPYAGIIREAVAEGIVVVFAAGNNHYDVLCNHDPAQCSPNTIWAANSLDEVLSVGTVNWDNRMDSGDHANSSRGPGQWASLHRKPDCVAPTYGEVVWGSGYQVMEWWGTSGACPQVAGLAALLLAAEPTLTPAEVGDLIRGSCDDISLPVTCAGAGLINCDSALNQVGPMRPSRRKAASRGQTKPAKKASKKSKAVKTKKGRRKSAVPALSKFRRDR